MRNLAIGLVIGFVLGSIAIAVANPSWLGTQEIWNRIFVPADNTIRCYSE